MLVNAVRTDRISVHDDLIPHIVNKVPFIANESIFVISSKIVSLSQGRIVKCGGTTNKDELIKQTSDEVLAYLDDIDMTMTITHGAIIPTAGIDESSGSGHYILYPENSFNYAQNIRDRLACHYKVKDIGVMIVDSRSQILRKGTIGYALAWAGFCPLKNYIGLPDLDGVSLKVTQANQIDALAAMGVMVMGEGDEQTPLAIISDVKTLQFNETLYTTNDIVYSKEEDIYFRSLKQFFEKNKRDLTC